MTDRTSSHESAAIRLTIIVVLLTLAPQLARAQYLDPGTGSFLFQATIAGLTLIIFFFSRIRTLVKRLVHRMLRKEQAG